MNEILNISRRTFLKTGAVLGGSLVLGFYLPFDDRLFAAPAAAKPAPNAFLRIAPDGIVTVIVPQSDMGQGVATSFPMIVAEELDVEWKEIRFEQSPADKIYANPIIGMQLTGGSTSVRAFWETLRRAGAAARSMLVAAAAATWRVDPGACHAEKGVVIHSASGRKLSYGALAKKAAALPVPEKITLKAPKDFAIVGKPTLRLDTPAKIRGRARFGIDTRLPGMLIAAVERCPVFGGGLAGIDDEAARKVPGVRYVMPIQSGIAVVADTFWAAQKGRDLLKVTWNESDLAGLTSAGITKAFAAAAQKEGPTARNDGNALKTIEAAQKRIEAVYEVPYLAHATMEPMNCTAHVSREKCEIWAPTQGQTLAQRVAAQLTGFSPESIIVHTTFLGCGFGRRAEQDFLADAVAISKVLGKPVKVVWTREDDIQHDHYRPATYNRLAGALDERGMPVAWMHRIVGPSILGSHASMLGMEVPVIDRTSVEGAADLPYDIPNFRVEYIRNEPGVPVGFWRSVGHSQNTFISESFLDELAAAGGKDPYELRRSLLGKHPRTLKVLELAADRAGWGSPLPPGRSRGIAVAEAYGSFVAQVAEVSVAGDGAVRVHRMVCALDCGTMVNPETIEAQLQGGIVFGLTAALKGAITLDKGRVQQSNFSDYEMLRMDEMPTVEAHLVKSGEAPGGVGEIAVPTAAPALANAVFAATGQRIRQLPIRAEALKR
jgi:isoquinoline 1-oxidoreductase subunit beta